MPICINCGKNLPRDSFSNKQLKNKAGPKCQDCVSRKNPPMNNLPPAAAPPPSQATNTGVSSENKGAVPAWGMNPPILESKPPAQAPIQRQMPNAVPAKKSPTVAESKTAPQQIPEKSGAEAGIPLPPSFTDEKTPLPPASKEEVKQNPYRDLEIYVRRIIIVCIFIYINRQL